MKCRRGLKENIFKTGMNLLFYVILIILIGCIIYPHTSFYYRKPILTPYALRLNVNSLVLEEGDTYRLYIVGFRNNAKFRSSDFKVAEVSSGGKVRANRKGKAVIRVKVNGKTLKCLVKVKEKEN